MSYSSYSQAWLEDPTSIRAVFVVANVLYDSSGLGTSYVSSKLYFSTDGLITSDGTIAFTPNIAGDITTTESLSPDGSIAMSFGGVKIHNVNGELDAYLDAKSYVFVNQNISVYYGDPTWSVPSADLNSTSPTVLKLIFNGIIGDVISTERSILDITIRDKMERLNVPVTEAKFGTAVGTWTNSAAVADTIKPLVFGEVFNMSPVLMDPNSGGGKYMVHDGIIEDIVEIRDNGVPIYRSNGAYTGATVDISTGTFILKNPPAGAITASVQGSRNSIDPVTGSLLTGTTAVSQYTNAVAGLVALIVTQYGKTGLKLTAADLDLDNIFDAGNLAPAGVVVTDTTNVLVVCQLLASSIGAQIFFTREGKLQLLKYGVGVTNIQDPSITLGYSTATTIDETDMHYDSMCISSKLPIQGAFKLGYCKNWTVQEALVTAIPADHKAMFANEWLTTSATATNAMLTAYKVTTDAVQKDTALITNSAAVTEAARLVAFFSVPRYIYKFTGVPAMLALRIGQVANIRHYRFNLYNSGNGRSGQVVALTPNWKTATIDVEVLV